eukprot:8450844-Pyramimonas_sp.AAC.1
MRRPPRSPRLNWAPWAWSHGNGRGCCADPNAAPYEEQLKDPTIQIWIRASYCKPTTSKPQSL